MPAVTVKLPSVETQTYFTFKEPINTYIKHKFNLDVSSTKLKVVSLISMKDMIKNDHRDPYANIYLPAGISEIEYKKDLTDNLYIVSFYFKNSRDVDVTFRVPINYINSIETSDSIEYVNRLIVIDMNRLPIGMDLTGYFDDIKDFITARYGVIPSIGEVGIGEVHLTSPNEHLAKETVRSNLTTVHKTMSARLLELENLYSNLKTQYTDLLYQQTP